MLNNLSRTLAEVMVSYSPFTILLCKYSRFGSGIFIVLLLNIMFPNTLNMVDIGTVPLPFSLFLILPHDTDAGPIGIELLLCQW